MSLEIAERILGNKAPEDRKAILGTARHPVTKKEIDSLVYIFYKGPHSYTGEDSLELFPHGNPLIVRSLIEALCSIENVRIAYRGEYTKRAFLNGKMDLVQAESVADVIHSQTLSALDNAHKLLSGRFSKEIHELSDKLKNISARIELDVDFVEEEAEPDVEGWSSRFAEIQKSIENLLAHFKSSGSLNRRPRIVLYGAPNAGKSSLLNALVGENRVLVSDVPGTTRDFIEVSLPLPSGEATLIDTAGLAKVAQNALDERSMQKSLEALETADLGICLVETPKRNEAEALRTIESAKEKKRWVIFSKADLGPNSTHASGTFISTKTGFGLCEFKNKLDKALFPEGESSEEFWITSKRELAALEEANAGLNRIQALLKTNPAVELIAFELKQVSASLAGIVGEISSESILQSIFNGFCIGK